MARGQPVRVGSRSGTPRFDWEDPDTWRPALRDVGAAYINYYPDLAIPGAAERVRAFVESALEHDVRRLVLLSGRGEEEAQQTERVVQGSGANWTILRASWFAQNFSDGFLLDGVRTGVLALPAGTVPEPFVDAEDIADVAVVALTDDRHAGQLYELTGPRLLTFAQAVDEIASATGRDIRYVQISSEEFTTGLAQLELPGNIVWLLTYLFDTVLDGRNASLADGVQRAIGREPRDFARYTRAAAASGHWNPRAATSPVDFPPAGSTTG